MRSASLVLAGLVLWGTAAPAQFQASSKRPWTDPKDNPGTPAKVALGLELFESTLLSQSRGISCATCHDPAAHFTDGLPQSKGVFGVGVGRNTPTLAGAALAPGYLARKKESRGKARSGAAGGFAVLTLEERCLTPIENPIEMGSSTEEAIRALRAAPGMNAKFDEAFDRRGDGATKERLARALAAYIRSIPLPDTAYQRFLDGDADALREEEARGLAIFNGRGACASCHSGPALSDGRIYALASGSSLRSATDSRTLVALLRDLRETDAPEANGGRVAPRHPLLPHAPPGKQQAIEGLARSSASYGPQATPAGQTPSLRNIARTGPYFRNGSVEDLSDAVRQHIHELNTVRPEPPPCAGMPAPDAFFATLPAPLRGAPADLSSQPRPAILSEREVEDLLAFLRTL